MDRDPKLLIIDDSELVRIQLLHQLNDEFDEEDMYFSETIEDAWEILNNEHIDLVLLDIYLPGKNGADLINDMLYNEQLKHIPIIVITGTKDDSFVKLSYEKYVCEYLHKPIDTLKLKKAIRSCLKS